MALNGIRWCAPALASLARECKGCPGTKWKGCHETEQQPRSHDFNVYSDRKVAEKLHYMHQNPVRRGLVSSPELWRWSSYRAFAFGEQGVVKLNWQPERKKGNWARFPLIGPARPALRLCGRIRTRNRQPTRNHKQDLSECRKASGGAWSILLLS